MILKGGNVTLLSVPLGKHALKRARYILHRFPFHTCDTLSNEVSIHQRVYFYTCITLSSKISIHQCNRQNVHEFLSFSSIAKHALQRGNYNLWRHCPYYIRISIEERFAWAIKEQRKYILFSVALGWNGTERNGNDRNDRNDTLLSVPLEKHALEQWRYIWLSITHR